MPSKKKDPVAYAALMDHLGITGDVAEHDAARLHWPGMMAMVTALAEQGKPLPPGIDPNSQYPQYSVTKLKKRDIDLGIGEPEKGVPDDIPF